MSSVNNFCESCGRAVKPDARFCEGCGRPVVAGVAAPEPAFSAAPPAAPPPAAAGRLAPPAPSRSPLLAIAIVAVTLGLAAGAYVWSQQGGGEKSTATPTVVAKGSLAGAPTAAPATPKPGAAPAPAAGVSPTKPAAARAVSTQDLVGDWTMTDGPADSVGIGYRIAVADRGWLSVREIDELIDIPGIVDITQRFFDLKPAGERTLKGDMVEIEDDQEQGRDAITIEVSADGRRLTLTNADGESVTLSKDR